MPSLDMFPDSAVDYILDQVDEDVAALQRLRLARRNCKKREKEYERAMRRMMKARNKLYRAIDDCEERGLNQLDPRSLE